LAIDDARVIVVIDLTIPLLPSRGTYWRGKRDIAFLIFEQSVTIRETSACYWRKKETHILCENSIQAEVTFLRKSLPQHGLKTARPPWARG
jgi:hypothetical protein